MFLPFAAQSPPIVRVPLAAYRAARPRISALQGVSSRCRYYVAGLRLPMAWALLQPFERHCVATMIQSAVDRLSDAEKG
jgi:hypothetical protein